MVLTNIAGALAPRLLLLLPFARFSSSFSFSIARFHSLPSLRYPSRSDASRPSEIAREKGGGGGETPGGKPRGDAYTRVGGRSYCFKADSFIYCPNNRA